ncbi:hypothetical protein QM012_001863 [Aureobasidium pullulans]|uniref:Uncharacterized protein n=1 Tax=Aureobasidium pullulans TaxID=5580 RepID=A0ABR0TE48_AURPU
MKIIVMTRLMQGSNTAKTSFMKAFRAKLFECVESRRASTYGPYGVSRAQQHVRKPALDGQVLANALGQIINTYVNEYGQLLIAHVVAETATMDPQDFEHMILPFFKGIITRLVNGKDENDMYRESVQEGLPQYISRFVG